MNPYPNYFQTAPMYNQPMYHPQAPMDRLAQLQAQQMQNAQMAGSNQFATIGKMVDSMDIVKATDIPMDGNMYYFPKADGSEIFVKQWLPNGTTQILTFKPALQSEQTNSPSMPGNGDMGKYESLEKRFNELSERFEKVEKYVKGRAKKEVVDE